jgi:flagellar motor switch protein FliM
MAEFLSQDEIDALLDIAEQGDDIDGTNPLDKFTAKEKNYSIYDFKKPNRVTLDQLKALTTMHDKMLMNRNEAIRQLIAAGLKFEEAQS